MTEPFPSIKLDEKSSDRVARGHRWVFSNDIKSIEDGAQSGAEVSVISSKNQHLGTALYNKHSLIAARVYTAGKEPFDAMMIQARLKKAADYRALTYPNRKTYRLVFSESDGLPGLIVDRYEDVLVAQFLTVAMDQRKALVVEVLRTMFSPVCIVERGDSSGREYEGLSDTSGVLMGTIPEMLIADLNGIKMRVDAEHGQKTGMYLDQVENWNLIRPIAKGAKVLDLFSNIGGFALNAAFAGATSVKAVDSSDMALSQLVLNAERNGLSQITAKKSDAFMYVRSRPEDFDVIVCDPPPFARSRKQVETALRGYRDLNKHCMKMLTPGGTLMTFSCSAAIAADDFDKTLMLAARDAGRTFRVLPGGDQPADHAALLAMPETRYLKARVLKAED